MLFHGFRNDEVFKYIAELGVRNQCFDRPNAQEMAQQASVIKIEFRRFGHLFACVRVERYEMECDVT